MKKRTARNLCLSLLAAGSVLAAGVNGALAYFTTYTAAEGGYVIHLGDRTRIEETFDSWTKHVTVTNDPESEPVYIRAKAFCARYGLVYNSPAGNWTTARGAWNEIVPSGADEYYYYTEIVNGGESTDVLNVVIDFPAADGESVSEDRESFNVIVIYESTPVRYHEDGTPYADWTEKLDVVIDTGEKGDAEAASDAGGGADVEN